MTKETTPMVNAGLGCLPLAGATILMFLVTGAAAALAYQTPDSSTRCELSVAQGSSPFARSYEHRFYRVVVSGGADDDTVLGTAYLVDPRGFFLTAGHVVRDPHLVSSDVRKGLGNRRLEVIRDMAGGDLLRIPVVEVEHGVDPNEYDITLLKALPRQAYTNDGNSVSETDLTALLQDVVPLSFLKPRAGDEGEILGFRVFVRNEMSVFVYETGKYRLRAEDSINELYSEFDPEDYEGDVFQGNSGSALVTHQGYGFAVVGAYISPESMDTRLEELERVLERRRFRVVHLFRVLKLIARIPTRPAVERILERISNRNSLTGVDLEIISKERLDALETIQLLKRLMQADAYVEVLRASPEFRNYVYGELDRNCLDPMERHWTTFLIKNDIRIADDSDEDRFYKDFLEYRSGAYNSEEVDQVVRNALIVYQARTHALPAVSVINLDEDVRKQAGRIYREFSEIQLAATKRFPDITLDQAEESLKLALLYNGEDHLTRALIALAAAERKDYELSLTSLKFASEISPSRTFSWRVERDFNAIANRLANDPNVEAWEKYRDIVDQGMARFDPGNLNEQRFVVESGKSWVWGALPAQPANEALILLQNLGPGSMRLSTPGII